MSAAYLSIYAWQNIIQSTIYRKNPKYCAKNYWAYTEGQGQGQTAPKGAVWPLTLTFTVCHSHSKLFSKTNLLKFLDWFTETSLGVPNMQVITVMQSTL